MLSEHRDLAATRSFFRSAKTITGVTPDRVTTDRLDAYESHQDARQWSNSWLWPRLPRGQDLAQQRAALRAAGCTRLFEEKASGGRWDRPELQRQLDHLQPGARAIIGERLRALVESDPGGQG
jgi:hypothetical protein